MVVDLLQVQFVKEFVYWFGQGVEVIFYGFFKFLQFFFCFQFVEVGVKVEVFLYVVDVFIWNEYFYIGVDLYFVYVLLVFVEFFFEQFFEFVFFQFLNGFFKDFLIGFVFDICDKVVLFFVQ